MYITDPAKISKKKHNYYIDFIFVYKTYVFIQLSKLVYKTVPLQNNAYLTTP